MGTSTGAYEVNQECASTRELITRTRTNNHHVLTR